MLLKRLKLPCWQSPKALKVFAKTWPPLSLGDLSTPLFINAWLKPSMALGVNIDMATKKGFSVSWINPLIMCVGLLSTQLCWAGFDVMDPYEDTTDFGHAQNETFQKAIGYDEPITPEEDSFLNSVVQQQVVNRWFFQATVGRPKTDFRKVVNQSPGAFDGLFVNRNGTSEDTFGFSLAWGYRWSSWAFNLEVLILESLRFDVSPVLAGVDFGLRSEIMPIACFFNIQYILPRMFSFWPKQLSLYLNAGAGLASKGVDAETLDALGVALEQASNRTGDFGWNLGVGLSYQVTGSLIVDLMFRFFDLGEAKIGTISAVELKSKEVRTQGLFLGITYLV